MKEKKGKEKGKKSNKNLWLSILIGASGAGGQATTSNARSQQQQQRHHSKGIITGIDVYYIELYILDLLLILLRLLLRQKKLLLLLSLSVFVFP